MRQRRLRRVAPLYWNAHWYGAADILREYLGLAPDYVIPLALPHGVDFGQVHPVQDLLAVEPIHWAHNTAIMRAVTPLKPALAIPHPFLLVLMRQKIAAREGTLVVGPPPGPVNDERLLALLHDLEPQTTTILVKPKNGYQQSMEFWRSHGFRAATLSDFGPANYDTMARLLNRTSTVIGCTFSSLVVFAAAAGAEVKLLRGYQYDCYDLVEIDSTYEVIDWQSPRASEIVGKFASRPLDEVTALARQILGSDLEFDPASIRAALDAAIRELDEPIYWRRTHFRATRIVARELAIWLRRPGVVRFNLSRWLRRRFRPRIWSREMDEIGIWLHGKSPQILAEQQIAYIAGLTEPGNAVRPYNVASSG